MLILTKRRAAEAEEGNLGKGGKLTVYFRFRGQVESEVLDLNLGEKIFSRQVEISSQN